MMQGWLKAGWVRLLPGRFFFRKMSFLKMEASSGYYEPVRNIPNYRSRSQDPELASDFLSLTNLF
jgi:hypothetical protein